MIKISTSILSSDNKIESIHKLNNTNNDYLHIDTMDGTFVPNKQMPIEDILEYEKISKVPLDIHLMVENPIEYIEKLNNKNIEYITIHYEINKNIDEISPKVREKLIKDIINKIKSLGYKVGLSIKPKTDTKNIYEYLDKVDMILIMSVEPGFGGQKFIPESIDKAKDIKERNNNIIIEMDGGIKDENINLLTEYVDIAVVGSYITNKIDYNEAINNLKN